MKYLLVFMLFGALLAGCEPAAEKGNATPLVPAENKSIRGIATETMVSREVATPDDSNITAQPTPIEIKPIQGTTATQNSPSTALSRDGWQTFASPTLGIALEYPPAWSVKEDNEGITFTSPQGDAIALSPIGVNNNDETMIGNQHCTSRTNAYNLTADICVETISFSYSAKFTLASSGGSTRQLTMKTITRGTTRVFDAMFNSLHLLK
jgi:uncharacterized membrane protein